MIKPCKNSSFFSSFRRLSQRPTAEELEQRNILHRECQIVVFIVIFDFRDFTMASHNKIRCFPTSAKNVAF